jgi:hypothetical protein
MSAELQKRERRLESQHADSNRDEPPAQTFRLAHYLSPKLSPDVASEPNLAAVASIALITH